MNRNIDYLYRDISIRDEAWKNTQSSMDPNSWNYWAIDQARGINNLQAGGLGVYRDLLLNPNKYANTIIQGAIVRPGQGIVEGLALDLDMKNPNYLFFENQRFAASGSTSYLDYQWNDKIVNSNIASGAVAVVNVSLAGAGIVCTIGTLGACAPGAMMVIGGANVAMGGYGLYTSYQGLKDPVYNMYSADSTDQAFLIGGQNGETVVFSTIQGAGSIAQIAGGVYMVKSAAGGNVVMDDGVNQAQSTGRITPETIKERLVMEEIKKNPSKFGEELELTLKDPRWPASEGWVKMRANVEGVEVHWVENTKTGAVADYKFKDY